MIRINLLPVKKIKAQRQVRKEIIVFCISLVFLLVVLAGAGMVQASRVSSIKNEMAKLEMEKKTYQGIIDQIEEIKKSKAELEKKLDVIRKLKRGSLVTVRMLDEVANLTPTNKIWLNSLSQDADVIRFTGVALDNTTIADYMNALSSSDYLADADLENTALLSVGGKKLTSFSFKCIVVSPDKKEAGAEEGAPS